MIITILAVGVAIDRAGGFVFNIPLQVVDNQKVQQAVIIHIHPDRANGPERPIFGIRLVEPGLGCYVGECAVSVVVIERVSVHARDKDIFVPIIVVVGDSDTHVIAGAGQASFFGNVREVPLTVAFEKAVRIF